MGDPEADGLRKLAEIKKLIADSTLSDNIAARAMTTDSPALKKALLELAAKTRVEESREA